MARFRKLVMVPGEYVTPDGPATVTAERIRHWVRQFAAMRAAGLQMPVAWGHQPDATPSDPSALSEAEALYRKSRYIAGWLENLEQDQKTGELWATGEAPALDLDGESGALIDPDLATAIREVSLGCGDFRDGQGRLWKDTVVHLALTPHPVLGGQSGFETATEGGLTMQRFGLSDLTARFALAADDAPGGGGGNGKDEPAGG